MNHTEDQVIIDHTRRWFESSTYSIESFATTLLIPALEDAGMAEIDRDSVESNVEAYTRWRRAASMRVGRIIRGQQPFPLAWKWIWIGCLPESHQVEIRRELVAMAGSLFVPIPRMTSCPAGQPATVANLHRVSLELGELLQSSKPAHDGRYDLNDDPLQVDRMIKEAVDLVEVTLAEVAAACAGTGRTMPRMRMMVIQGEGQA